MICLRGRSASAEKTSIYEFQAQWALVFQDSNLFTFQLKILWVIFLINTSQEQTILSGFPLDDRYLLFNCIYRLWVFQVFSASSDYYNNPLQLWKTFISRSTFGPAVLLSSLMSTPPGARIMMPFTDSTEVFLPPEPTLQIRARGTWCQGLTSAWSMSCWLIQIIWGMCWALPCRTSVSSALWAQKCSHCCSLRGRVRNPGVTSFYQHHRTNLTAARDKAFLLKVEFYL